MRLRLILGLLLVAVMSFAQTHSVTLTWTDTSNPAGTTYSVYRVVGLCSGSPTFAKIATAVTDKTYIDTTVQPGNYCYTVTASFNGAESSPSNSEPALVLPFPPTGLTAVVQ